LAISDPPFLEAFEGLKVVFLQVERRFHWELSPLLHFACIKVSFYLVSVIHHMAKISVSRDRGCKNEDSWWSLIRHDYN